MKITTWRRFPICLFGYDVVRWEGYEFKKTIDVIFDGFRKKFIFWKKSDLAGPSHIQYEYSKFGFLITWPFCIHIWYQFHPSTWYQKPGNDDPSRVPGSEKVVFLSIGWARWDSQNRCYMVPRCYIGGNYD